MPELLHNHPRLEKASNLDRLHVIVDREDIGLAKRKIAELEKQLQNKTPLEFIEAVETERDMFVQRINGQEWNTNTRCAAESLLIIYDQMAARLTEKIEIKEPVNKTNQQ
ncbi:hypothetical protein [Draconibacterium orientale]|uniref:hypothetical protein n=1 Tax=Draconibacterium orientale TaxID=1168034 RepID=UPI0029BFE605|nr:hypothetical protein [Draconibacterium orientale]